MNQGLEQANPKGKLMDIMGALAGAPGNYLPGQLPITPT